MARPHSRPAIPDAPMSRAAETSGRRPLAVSLLISLRPGQWTKNLIVFAGLVFSLKLFEPGAILTSIEAFVIFCALSGIVYLFNDVMDRESDRRHPTKCRRPIAAGDLPVSVALAAAGAHRRTRPSARHSRWVGDSGPWLPDTWRCRRSIRVR